MATQQDKSTAAPAETEAPARGDTSAAPTQGGSTAVAQTSTAGAEDDGKVGVKLAHPLGNKSDMEKDTLRRLGLDPERAYQVGEEVRVRRDDARTLITAGYAQVDPEDSKAVREALNPSK